MYADQIQNKREYQEDRYLMIEDIVPGYDYFAVFDGHGGAAVSDLANSTLHKFVKIYLSENISPVTSLYKSFEDLHNLINPQIGFGCGSAAVVGLRDKQKNKVYIANSGDSRAIRKGGDITIDHKPNLSKEYNRIVQGGGGVFFVDGVPRLNGDLALSRAFGDFRLNPVITWKPDIYTLDYDGLLILASDGLWDVMNTNEVVNMFGRMEKTNDRKTICNQLFKEAVQRGSGDNITILVV